MLAREPAILCATDFSPGAARGVDLAAMASRAFRLPLVLAHVMDTGRDAVEPAPAAVARADAVLHQRVRTRVDQARGALEREVERCGQAAEVVLLDGRPWEAIVRHAEDIGASLIVVGAHGTSGPAHIMRDGVLAWLLGSTSDRVIRSAHRPVLVATPGGALPALGGTRWLVGVAIDDTSGHALEVALRFAARAAAHVEVVYVGPTDALSGEHDAGPEEDRATESSLASLALASSKAAGVDRAPPCSLLHGDPATALVAAASEGGGLVIVGTHRRRGVTRAVLGSVAERVLRFATTPVMVVPPP